MCSRGSITSITSCVGFGLFVVWAAAISASDRTAVYARVDKVVMEPTADAPERVQVWGVFSMAKPDDVSLYLPPARGYLYFALKGHSQAAAKEWADLQAAASTGQIVSFGSRWELKARVRNADEKPVGPDPYVVSIGLTKVRGNTGYAPIRALLDARP
jgi:hypothetical protein